LSYARRALETSDAQGTAQAREDRSQAELWLGKSIAAWREAQADPAFGPPHRREMQQVEAALAALKSP